MVSVTRPAADAVAGTFVEPLALHHQPRIEALCAALDVGLSEYSFANLYLFRHIHDYQFVEGDRPCLLGRTYDGHVHAMLFSPPGDAWPYIGDFDIHYIYPVPEAWLPSGDAPSWNAADSDYVYDASSLASLGSPALKVQRKQADGYAERHGAELTLDPDGFDALATAVLDRWLDQVAKPALATDDAMCRQAIALADTLGLERALVTSGGEPHGFLLASRLPDGSKAVHFAKARRDLPGAYPFLFSRYAAVAGTATLNFEQDLGRPGFRQAKRALAPRGQLRKYRIARG